MLPMIMTIATICLNFHTFPPGGVNEQPYETWRRGSYIPEEYCAFNLLQLVSGSPPNAGAVISHRAMKSHIDKKYTKTACKLVHPGRYRTEPKEALIDER